MSYGRDHRKGQDSDIGAGTTEGRSPGRRTQVQLKGTGRKGVTTGEVRDAASDAVSGPGAALPHAEKIQASFGPDHDVSTIQAHTGGAAAAACDTVGGEAFASGNNVAFRDASPSLHTAAHEAAHVMQQRGGVQLKGGVGEAGDAHEKHADAVADRVVSGQSAADLLSGVGGGQSLPGAAGVQFLGQSLDKPLDASAPQPAHGEDAGEQRRWSVEQYLEMWEKEQGRKLTDAEKQTIARGCIGITANNISGGGNPPLDQAYADFDMAHDAMVKQNQALDQMRTDPRMRARVGNKHAILFAKLFWSNQSADPEKRKKGDDKAFQPDPKTGRVDMSNYEYRAQPGYINFDYGFWDEASQCFWHANHAMPGMKVYQSTKDKFVAGYIDFDRCIFCVAVAENYDPGLAAMASAARGGGGN
jgi:hypothetical protein